MRFWFPPQPVAVRLDEFMGLVGGIEGNPRWFVCFFAPWLLMGHFFFWLLW